MATQIFLTGCTLAVAPPEAVQTRFNQLADRWLEETEGLSSSTAIILNSAYQQIIGVAQAVLPLILQRLESQGGHWFWALDEQTRAVVGDSPRGTTRGRGRNL